MIQVQGLKKKFGPNLVLDGLDLHLSPAGITALVGHNGCGKTTFLKCVLGLVKPTSGTILFDGIDVTSSVQYRRQIGYMPQITHFPENLNAHELINMVVDLRGEGAQRLEQLLTHFDFHGELSKPLRHMSGGTRQKVNAIIALMFTPRFLALDEPTAGLDPLASQLLKEFLLTEKADGKTILITSHNIQELEEISDQVLYLADGIILYNGSIEDLKRHTSQENLEQAIAFLMKQSA